MKSALLTVGLTAVFFCIGTVGFLKLAPGPSEDAAADSTAAATPMVEASEVADMAAELAELQDRLQEAEAQADSLRTLMAARQDESEADEAADAQKTAELASTLTKMEPEALGPVVQQLDGRSFVQLYEATSSRNRQRLLDALTPAQAAAFVRYHLPDDGRPAHVVPVSTADTTATP